MICLRLFVVYPARHVRIHMQEGPFHAKFHAKYALEIVIVFIFTCDMPFVMS